MYQKPSKKIMTADEIKNILLSLPHTKTLRFDKDAHEYFNFQDGKEVQLYGITSVISKYKNPFDREGISKGVAFRDGISQEEVLEQWDEKRDTSIEYGNLIHDSFEMLIETGEVNTLCEAEISILTNSMALFDLRPILAEYLVLETKFGRASAIDILALNANNELVICDIKTPEKGILYEGYKNKTMLFPLQNLPDSSFYHYSLQTTIYDKALRDLTKNTGLKVADQHYLLYVRGDVGFPIPTLYLEKEYEKLVTFENQ